MNSCRRGGKLPQNGREDKISPIGTRTRGKPTIDVQRETDPIVHQLGVSHLDHTKVTNS
jgi:hypothetical protein